MRKLDRAAPAWTQNGLNGLDLTRLTLTPVALALVAGALALGPAPLRAEAATEAEPAAAIATADLPAITVSGVTKRQMQDIIVTSGLVSASETVLVAPLVEGQQILSLLANVGDKVTEGQVLAELSTATLSLQKAQLEASLTAARTNADEARKTAERVLNLFNNGNAAASTKDQAQMAATAAQSQLSQLESQLANIGLMLERTKVVAPVGGTISARNAQVGGVASAAGQPMFQILRDGALELRADVAQSDLLRLAPGQKVMLRTAGVEGMLEGSVSLVEPMIDPMTRLGKVRIAIDKPELVRAGMFMEAMITVADHEALAIPVTAMSESAKGVSVMRLGEGDVLAETVVKTGIRQGGWIEVLEGLAEGDQIVTKAGAFVRSGDRIRPVAVQPASN